MSENLTNTSSKPLIFIDIKTWHTISIHNYSLLITLNKDYKILTTTIQLQEIRRILFNKYPNIIELLINLPPEELERELEELMEINSEFVKYYKEFLKIISNNIYLILIPNESHISRGQVRASENKPPFPIGAYTGDLISWECIINSTLIPSYSELHIYTESTEFTRDKKIHPFLSFEWKTKNHGNLLLYDSNYIASKKSQQQIHDKITQHSNKLSLEYIKNRFKSIELLLENNFRYLDSFNKQENLTLLRELKYLYTKLLSYSSQSNLSSYQISCKKYEELFNKYFKNKN